MYNHFKRAKSTKHRRVFVGGRAARIRTSIETWANAPLEVQVPTTVKSNRVCADTSETAAVIEGDPMGTPIRVGTNLALGGVARTNLSNAASARIYVQIEECVPKLLQALCGAETDWAARTKAKEKKQWWLAVQAGNVVSRALSRASFDRHPSLLFAVWTWEDDEVVTASMLPRLHLSLNLGMFGMQTLYYNRGAGRVGAEEKKKKKKCRCKTEQNWSRTTMTSAGAGADADAEEEGEIGRMRSRHMERNGDQEDSGENQVMLG
ncbi:hypothetical protein BU24DRAFT_414147 [Aaosphaeria arxii CBS 175.79]|uniref:Uncharacterized protein n=1 Tax=Aaosphaeria arxii CBS 175.79 TaxID=1450172 RepID=A0A6A5XBW0_9PLEO|nr:uncharacterized protein BU24DRAFT_414147 [Aaosphaeria arxii CBS 175.79]KAF2010575.1 hypothetical protein BU24DRAFT_414147 [Aaosphaeria arxii CBS 175.79]